MTENNAANAAEQEIDAIMKQARVFASAWAFFGGPFDQGTGKENAEREETNLRDLIRDALSKLRAEGVQAGDERAALQKLVDLEHMRIRLRTLHESGHGTDYDAYHKALPAAWEAARAALASAPVADERECGDAGCGWRGTTERMCGGVGPLCPECGEVTEASAPVVGEARAMDWQNALRIAELPEVDEALANFCDDSTLDNAVGLVLAVLGAAPQAREAVRNPSLIDLLVRAQAWMATTHGTNRPSNLIRLIDEALAAQKQGDSDE
ncbi:hypothetical protein [Achromobacter spanius]